MIDLSPLASFALGALVCLAIFALGAIAIYESKSSQPTPPRKRLRSVGGRPSPVRRPSLKETISRLWRR